MSAPDRSYKLPPDLTVEDMPGNSPQDRRLHHSLYRRGQLSAIQRRNILRKVERMKERGDAAAGEG